MDEEDSKKISPFLRQPSEFDFDSLLKTKLGEFGLYQQIVVWFLCIPACFLSAYSTMDLVFMAYTPDHKCDLSAAPPTSTLNYLNSSDFSGELTVVGEQCEYVYYNGTDRNSSLFKKKCDSWTYDDQYFDQTLVTRWNLVCDKDTVKFKILSLLNAATLLSAIYTYIQDRWGRKRAFVINLTVFLVGNCCSLLAPSPMFFAVLKFLGGITCMWEICYCWGLEFVGPTKRTALTTMMSVIYGMAAMSLALVAYLCRNWREIGLSTSVPFILLYSYTYFVPESPRWLLAQGRTEEALDILESMAKWNKAKVDFVQLRKEISSDIIYTEENSSVRSDRSSASKLSLKEFFSSTNLLKKMFLLTFVSVVGNQLYYAIPYTLEHLNSNFYISYVLQSAVEAPASFLNIFLLNRFGRVLPLSFSLLLSGFACLISWPAENVVAWGAMLLAALARFFISTSVCITEQLAGELYPTVARGTGLGFSYFVSAVASVCTPFVIELGNDWSVLPMIVFGCFTLVAGALALFLPETMGKSMPDTIAQAEAQGSVGFKAFRGHFGNIFHYGKCGGKKTYVIVNKV